MMDENPQVMPPPQYADGSRVLCADGQTLGEVVATYREYLIVERGYFFPTNFYVPYAAIAEAGGGDIVLALNGQDALAQGWHTPPEDPVVPEVPVPPPPPVVPVATTAVPIVPVAAEPVDESEAAAAVPETLEAEPAVTTTAAPMDAAAEEPEVAPETETARATPTETTTTGPPAAAVEETVAVEEVVEVQSIQPDASVPPPAEPEEAGTVSLAPTFVGIPGRRLTDAELWSLLEPKDAPADTEGQSEDAGAEKEPPEKPGS